MRQVLSSLVRSSRYFQYTPTRFAVSVRMDALDKPVENSIKKKLTAAFNPAVLEVKNESFMHKAPKGSETHFKVLVVTDKFESLPLIKRHRMVNDTLQEELESGVHALSIVLTFEPPHEKTSYDIQHPPSLIKVFTAKTLAQWEESDGKISRTPACRGGLDL